MAGKKSHEKARGGRSPSRVEMKEGRKEAHDSKTKDESKKKSRAKLKETRAQRRGRPTRTFLNNDLPSELKEDGADEEKPAEATLKPSPASAKEAWAHAVLAHGVKKLVKTFRGAKGYAWEAGTSAAFEKNSEKNRYDDVKCFDQTRVILKNTKNDYIHANFVETPKGAKFICAQAPLDTTIDDFWKMLVQEDISCILMLCPLAEDGTEKSALYWPLKRDSKAEYGGIRVTHKEQKQQGDTTITVLNVEPPSKSARTLYHLQYDKWPDHFSPEDPKETVAALKLAKQKAGTTPIVVHCSAGIGRTCTVVAVEWAYSQLKANEVADMVKILQEIRKQRAQGIQNQGQFVFVHVCVLQLLVEEKELKKEARIANFFDEYSKFVRHQMEKFKKKKEEKKDDDE